MSAPSTSAIDNGELDILRHVSVSVPCPVCGQHYTVTLRQVLLSQQLLHEGCPVAAETECPQVNYAALADETTLREFERAWTRILGDVQGSGLELTLSRPLLSH